MPSRHSKHSLGCNWPIYIWSVNAGYILQVSLGYYIKPLFNVLLRVCFLQERLRSVQWLAHRPGCAYSAHRLTLATLGLFLYISPRSYGLSAM